MVGIYQRNSRKYHPIRAQLSLWSRSIAQWNARTSYQKQCHLSLRRVVALDKEYGWIA